MKLEKRVKAVQIAWKHIEDMEPDISTERLLAMVAEYTGEDYGDITSLYVGKEPGSDG